MKNNKGFTLVELLIVVSLIIITVGVASDIVVIVVRSYNKTQITNEVEQNANFVLNKLEKELRNAVEVTHPSEGASDNEVTFVQALSDGTTETISYSVVDASDKFGADSDAFALGRNVDGGSFVALTNYTSPLGVNVDQGVTSFELVTSNPDTVKVTISLRQIGNPAVQFTQNTTLEKTIVVRGSY